MRNFFLTDENKTIHLIDACQWLMCEFSFHLVRNGLQRKQFWLQFWWILLKLNIWSHKTHVSARAAQRSKWKRPAQPCSTQLYLNTQTTHSFFIASDFAQTHTNFSGGSLDIYRTNFGEIFFWPRFHLLDGRYVTTTSLTMHGAWRMIRYRGSRDMTAAMFIWQS